MPITLIGIFFLALLTFSSCKKSPDPGGSWTFLGTTYYVAGCDTAAGGSLNASNANGNNTYTYGTIGVRFHGRMPATAGTYTVVKFPPADGQAAITVGINGSFPTTNYNSTGGNGAETITVSLGSNGLINVSGSGIMMSNASGGTDSSTLSVNITRIQ